ncbi:AAA family ATPase [Roseofilum capinflatum]|uniref:Nuclease SbcCD subunit C n=1 Tax=Roseofilum capinflatum BLCC-M114 TaxID=3022440 RepID=A0ABT7BBU6_9CYAN|nr:SMC family ATPase [Roseofilum capinflatum]MDJ1176074.1 SMC family ATPase [Roseofilum capinflatum BLCC-M114]
MEILSISLKNFKSHADLYLEFEPGSNAICGENGAGKTSILEAIAWVMFNSCEYQREDLIRKGSKSAQATVQFISNQDGRTYQVKRCTRRGYELYDPQIDSKLDPTKVNDVVLWLQEHLGIPKDVDLAKVFSDAIGIPQGTFTVDFLKKPGDRKAVFDPILRVEEYKKAQEKSRELERFAEQEVTTCTQHLERFDVQLEDWQALQDRHEEFNAGIEKGEVEKKAVVEKLNTLEQRQEKFKQHQQQVEECTRALQGLEAEYQRVNQECYHREKAYHQAQESAQKCDDNKASYLAYERAEGELRELGKSRQSQQQLLREKEQQGQSCQRLQHQLTKLEMQRESCQVAERKIEQLAPGVEEQNSLEEKQQILHTQLQAVQDWRREQERTEQQLYECLERLNEVKQEADRLQALEPSVAQIPQLEEQLQKYQGQLSRVAAAQQFAQEIDTLIDLGEQQRSYYQQLQPLLPSLEPQVQTLITSGKRCQDRSLERLDQMASDLNQQVSEQELTATCEDLRGQLELAYQCRAELKNLPSQRKQEAQLKQEGQELRSRLIALEEKIEGEEALSGELKEIGDRLQQLANPKGQRQLLEQQLASAPNIAQEWQQLTEQHQAIQHSLDALNEQLSTFETLEAQISKVEQLKQEHSSGYLLYVQSEKEAQTLEERQQSLEKISAKRAQLETEKQQKQAELDRLSSTYSLAEIQQVDQDLQNLNNRLAQLEATLSFQRQQLTEICQSLVKKGEIAKKREQTLVELQKAQRNWQFVKDARFFFNQASPRITKFYLAEISQEADTIFRELMNRQNVALEWTEDYDIVVQEDGHKRNFKSLSGGEQMCAALAVRLAILRTLSDLDIAFFDEPTTNMDRPRRQLLAEAIGNLKSFRQLFVISHDDTFENMSNLIHIQRS